MQSAGVRIGAWLVGIPAIVEVFRIAGAVDRRSRSIATYRYEFWSSGFDVIGRAASVLAIVLLLLQLVMLAVGGLAGAGRWLVVVVGLLQAVFALPAVIYDLYLSSNAPSFVSRLAPLLPGGRFVSALVLLVALAGAITAVAARRPGPGSEAGPVQAKATDPGGAAWHPDPGGSGRMRWWDGAAWTDHLS